MTTINEKLQVAAEDSFRKGLRNYSKRSGWNGPIESLKIDQNFEWVKTISNYKKPAGLYNDEIAIVKK